MIKKLLLLLAKLTILQIVPFRIIWSSLYFHRYQWWHYIIIIIIIEIPFEIIEILQFIDDWNRVPQVPTWSLLTNPNAVTGIIQFECVTHAYYYLLQYIVFIRFVIKCNFEYLIRAWTILLFLLKLSSELTLNV